MAPVASDEIVFTYDKKAKEKVRKCGESAKRKAVQLGLGARVFSAVVHFNPTYGKLDGAVYVPQGQSIPDVNRFLAELANGMQGIGGQRRVTRRRRGETTPKPSQTTVEAGDNKVGQLTDSATEESVASAAEAAEANEVVTEDSDAPHEIEANDNGVADICGIASDTQQGDARLDEDPTNPAQHEIPTETAPFSENRDDMTEDVAVVDTDTAAKTNAGEEDSFIGFLEVGMHDLFEMEAKTTSRFDPSGPVDDSRQEEQPNTTMPDWESGEVEKTRGDAVMENTAESNEEAPGRETKTQKTPTAAVAPVFRIAKNTKKIHRFFWQVSKQIRLARRQGEFEIGHIRQIRLGVKAVREVRATVQSRGNRNARPACGGRNPPRL
ncbi:uncharacterized protein ColSpa_11902 [Colletotrichum spaethianum]|uniref:Uncharacterized protein n=1 Tax=Colletotrichum spaethianum TaxID=700344 RepID=A0AA37ULH0_9PEZI|nr:uncharacterized protein ColSpa_11902 [Colletotrichum spaethianum]GKT51721.1 hypothetical protein ColSpa_11902 [Colletotrichum spaethianum]